MATVKEVYERLEKLIQDNPKVCDLEFTACGAFSVLNVFREGPNGNVTGLSLEDADFMRTHVGNAEEYLKDAGKENISENYKEYLIQMSVEERSDKEIAEFVANIPKPEVEISLEEEFASFSWEEKVIKLAETEGWRASQNTSKEFVFTNHTPEGQELYIEISATEPDDLISELKDKCENYDCSYEAYIWLDNTGHGDNGAPYDMKDVYEDMEKALEMMEALCEKMDNFDFEMEILEEKYSIENRVADAQEKAGEGFKGEVKGEKEFFR